MQSHPDMSGLCSADDGYSWMKSGQQTVPGWGCPTIYYECAHEKCKVKKSVALSVDGQILETVYRGSHNHPRPTEMLLRDVQVLLEPDSQRYVLPEVFAAGTLMRGATERDAQLPFSTDTNEEEGDSEDAGADCEFSIEANTTQRLASVSPRRNTPFTSQRSERRSKSKVWDEFTAVLSDGRIQGAECKHCKKCLSAKSSGGTSHLHRHLKTCPAQSASARMQQLRSSSHLVASPENGTFDQDKSHELLTKALISNFCSFSLASSVYFRQFLAGICPTYHGVSQAAMEEKFLRIFENEKLKLKDQIKLAPGRVFISATDWGPEFRAFICLTVHFIDTEWKMNRKVIRCCFLGDINGYDDSYEDFFMFPDWESYRKLFDEGAKVIIKEVIQDWSLEHKLLGIVSTKVGVFWSQRLLVDASMLDMQLNPTWKNNYIHADYKLFSLPCMLDIFYFFYPNSFVRDISRDCFKYMTCSPLRREKYNEILSRVHLYQPSFGSKQRQWFYYILEAFFQFNKVLLNPEHMDSQSNPSKPSYEKLEAAQTFCNLSRPMYHALKVFSDPCNETLNLQHFHAICRWKIALLGSSMKANINQVCDVERVRVPFDELWRNWYPWLSLAVVLDPRYKIRFLDRLFKQTFGNNAKSYIYEVRGKIYELFFRYSIHADQPRGEKVNDYISDLQLDAQGHSSIPVHDTSYIEQSAHEEIGELVAYLEGDLIPQDVPFDILKWWKANASTYPTLARLARDILAIPISTVSAESIFDETDERESLFNRKMSPQVVEALICTQDWIKSSEIGDGDGENRNISA